MVLNNFARIGYGYIIDNEYPEYPDYTKYEKEEDFDKAVDEYFDFIEAVYNSPFCYALNDGEDPTFFGIIYESTDSKMPYIALDCPHCCESPKGFQGCYDEFIKFFPDSEQEPQLYLLSMTI